MLLCYGNGRKKPDTANDKCKKRDIAKNYHIFSHRPSIARIRVFQKR